MLLLETKKLTKRFGGLTAVNSLELQINQGEIVGLIGPNGAGKTTVFNLITGFFPPSNGTILLNGERVEGLRPHNIAQKGCTRTFQPTKLFSGYSVIRNVLMAQHLYSRIHFWDPFVASPSLRDKENMLLKEVESILDLVGISEQRNEQAQDLPHGHQQALGIAIALATHPKLLLLDEPATGMNPEESFVMMERIRKIANTGITIGIIEHDMKVIMNLCSRIIAINYGKKIAEGTPKQIRENPEVIQAYLGKNDVSA
jgi:branched-chain amino acid transport system ATP-binding protein